MIAVLKFVGHAYLVLTRRSLLKFVR